MTDGANITPDPTTKADAALRDEVSRELTDAIDELMRLGLVEAAIREDGEWVYRVTEDGRAAIAEAVEIGEHGNPWKQRP